MCLGDRGGGIKVRKGRPCRAVRSKGEGRTWKARGGGFLKTARLWAQREKRELRASHLTGAPEMRSLIKETSGQLDRIRSGKISKKSYNTGREAKLHSAQTNA